MRAHHASQSDAFDADLQSTVAERRKDVPARVL